MRCGALAGFATDLVGISSQQTIGAASARLCSADSTEMCDDLPFKPQFGPAGSRKLLALVTRDGLAVDQIEIGSHTAPTLRQPAPVKRVRLVRVGHSVIVARHKHRIEGHYPAVAETGDGEAWLHLPKPGCSAVRVKGVRRSTSVRASVWCILCDLNRARTRLSGSRAVTAAAPTSRACARTWDRHGLHLTANGYSPAHVR